MGALPGCKTVCLSAHSDLVAEHRSEPLPEIPDAPQGELVEVTHAGRMMGPALYIRRISRAQQCVDIPPQP